MQSSIDLIVLPLFRSGGLDSSDLPGLLVALPPRRTAHGREEDQLILYFDQDNSQQLLSAGDLDALLEQTAIVYYQTTGSSTSAQRIAAEWLNDQLIESTGGRATGILTAVILRGDQIWLAQSGPGHVYRVSPLRSEHIYDPYLGGQGLGSSRTAILRYSNIPLQINESLLISVHPPSAWMGLLQQHQSSPSLESLRRKLLSQAGKEVKAVLLQAQAGSGNVRLFTISRAAGQPSNLRQSTPPASASPVASSPTPSKPAPTSPAPSAVSQPSSSAPAAPQTPPAEKSTASPASAGPATLHPPTHAPQSEAAGPTARAAGVSNAAAHAPLQGVQARQTPASTQTASKPVRPAAKREKQATSRPRPDYLTPLAKSFAALHQSLAKAWRALISLLASLFRRMAPDESVFTIAPSTMAFIAIAVPVILVSVAGFVYVQRGRATQFETYMAQAKAAEAEAVLLSDPNEQHSAWGETLQYLDQAEFYLTTPESQLMRQKAQGILDTLDEVERLNFQPALAKPLPETAQITQMVVSGPDLYMLNAKEGVVHRAIFTKSGYLIDPAFQCGPGPYDSFIVGAIIDITPLPKGNEMKASIAGIDGNGNLLYCIPGSAPLAAPLAPPDTGWGQPEGITQEAGDLYVLDPQYNAVWIYRGMDTASQPRLFFAEDIPQMLDVIDLAVNGDDLFLLHSGGRMTKCTFSGLTESPTRCDDPAQYTDNRPGRQSGPLIEGAHFTEVLYVPPPDPSVYLLEPNSQAIYRLSVLLNFNRQYRSGTDLPEEPVTAFAFDQASRIAFLAIGNQVYYATLP